MDAQVGRSSHERVRRVAARASICLMLIATFGCGKEAKTAPVAVNPVRGLVLLNAKPLPDATVYFHPLEPHVDIPRPHAVTGADGSFKLSTFRLDDGAPAGGYRVTVSCKAAYDGKSEDRDEEARELLPSQYQRPESSGIAVEIRQGENDLSAFDLRGPAS